MPRESLERLREALARLPTASRADLRAEWLRLYRTEAPARLGRELLIVAIAYRLQEEALGGLRPELHRRLRNIAEQAGPGGYRDKLVRPVFFGLKPRPPSNMRSGHGGADAAR